jgi:tRNA 2-thiouridine synthesizing protein B
MATLHIVNHEENLASCLEVASRDDAILLIEDAVYASIRTQPRAVLAIEDDIQARGISTMVDPEVSRIDYMKMVELVTTHEPVVSWG